MKYICTKSSNQEILSISLSSCSRYNANFKFDQSVFATHDSSPYFCDQWGWPPTETRTVTHALDHYWWTLDFANAFVSLGVNSQAELLPSPQAYARNGAPRRWLGDNIHEKNSTIYTRPVRFGLKKCRFFVKNDFVYECRSYLSLVVIGRRKKVVRFRLRLD
jgi:hypothetical protein